MRLIDSILFVISIYVAFVLRFDIFDAWNQISIYLDQVYFILPVKLLFFSLVGVYRPVLRYVGLEFLGMALVATIGSTGILTLIDQLLVISSLPRSILILDSLITLLMVVGVRIIIRWGVYYAVTHEEQNSSIERMIVYGAGDAGIQLVRALATEKNCRVVGFIDDDKQLQNQSVSGITVHSPTKLQQLVKRQKADSVLLAIPSAGKQRRRDIVKQIEPLKVNIKTIPGIGEIVSGKVSIDEIRKIDIADLLGREEVKPIQELLDKNIKNKVVFVTGAGGSIGAELCRQIAELEPAALILFELNEYALYAIDMKLKESFPHIPIYSHLGSVVNQAILEKLFLQHKVQTLYHAAAYKHVPLIESNKCQGAINNIFGTLSCARAASICNIETFVLISTDKAVRPTNVMGATKRIAELLLQAFANVPEPKTKFVMVRFGNVLDSKGSVVPRFRKQLKDGQNLTLTHQEITRYFMSIPEAVRLVIQAGSLGNGGDLFLLDMGDPVKIYDLATQMIKLSGLSLGEDIGIDIVGLRPGEKLFEELLIDKNKVTATSHPKIFSTVDDYIPWDLLKVKLEKLQTAIDCINEHEIAEILQEIVPEYHIKQSKN